MRANRTNCQTIRTYFVKQMPVGYTVLTALNVPR